ncbi:MAG: hypothetical protein K2Z81_10810 [Cyanobacteria bacterium]|nr:hypothetical protein [Cyanobacteriota bacterium]
MLTKKDELLRAFVQSGEETTSTACDTTPCDTNELSLENGLQPYQLYSAGKCMYLLDAFQQSRRMAVVHLLDAVSDSLHRGDAMVAFISFRTVIEHVAVFNDLLRDMGKLNFKPQTIEDAVKLNSDMESLLVKRVFGTRVNWLELRHSDADVFLASRKTYEYKPSESSWDRTSEQVMYAVDKLKRKVKRARGVYEVLCEFAHPNVGALLALTRQTSESRDEQGVRWIHKTLSLDSPDAFVHDLANLIGSIVRTSSECVKLFESQLEELEKLKAATHASVQMVAKELLATSGEVIDPDSRCPCTSGRSIRTCCGS